MPLIFYNNKVKLLRKYFSDLTKVVTKYNYELFKLLNKNSESIEDNHSHIPLIIQTRSSDIKDLPTKPVFTLYIKCYVAELDKDLRIFFLKVAETSPETISDNPMRALREAIIGDKSMSTDEFEDLFELGFLSTDSINEVSGVHTLLNYAVQYHYNDKIPTLLKHGACLSEAPITMGGAPQHHVLATAALAANPEAAKLIIETCNIQAYDLPEETVRIFNVMLSENGYLSHESEAVRELFLSHGFAAEEAREAELEPAGAAAASDKIA